MVINIMYLITIIYICSSYLYIAIYVFHFLFGDLCYGDDTKEKIYIILKHIKGWLHHQLNYETEYVLDS
jgi:hypothetical protein